jgi:hypothetical protein
VAELEQAIQAWIDTWNEDPRPFVWTKTADEVLGAIAHYCQRINDSVEVSLRGTPRGRENRGGLPADADACLVV